MDMRLADRRGSRRVRDCFESACKMLAPLIGEGAAGNSAACFKAMRHLHEAYPDLSPEEVEALAMAVCRTLRKQT